MIGNLSQESTRVSIPLIELHTGQRAVIAGAKRFNVICCGRRWGKTVFCSKLLLHPWNTLNGALNGFPVAYMAPTYKKLMESWREVVAACYPIIKSKSETEHRIELTTGGVMDFWSLDMPDGPRGRKYKRVIVDEAAWLLNLTYIWNKVLRPCLADYRGDAWLLSTPKGRMNYFYDLFTMYKRFPDTWVSWQMPTSINPHIPPDELLLAEQELDPITYAQEYLASFVTENLDQFAYCFSETKHIGTTELNRQYEIKLSFDFNRNPITCAVFQDYGGVIRGIEQIKLANSNIYSLCDYINAKYGGMMMIITGDATGKASSALVKDNINYYTVIKSKLNLSNAQIKTPTINPPLAENRVLVNSVLHNREVILDSKNCKHLIFDLIHAQMLPDGSLDKTDRNDPTRQLDALDCFRYYLNTFFRNTLKT